MRDDAASASLYAAPDAETHTSATDDMLAAYVGPRNALYYERRFERFIAGDHSLTWHWPAFFITSGWLLYRKMWLWAFLYWIVFPVVNIAIGIGVTLVTDGDTGAWAWFGSYLLAGFVVFPMFANQLYYRHVRAKVDQANSVAVSDAQKILELERKGGTSLLACVFALLPVISLFAVNAILDFNQRNTDQQIAQAYVLTAPVKRKVTEFYFDNDRLPVDSAEAGVGEISSNYVESVTVSNGDILIRYGNEANSAIHGRTLEYRAEIVGTNVEWICYTGDIPLRYAPYGCRRPIQ